MRSQTARKARGNHLGYFVRQDIHWDIQNLLYSRRLKTEMKNEMTNENINLDINFRTTETVHVTTVSVNFFPHDHSVIDSAEQQM